jgi:hypothetical protein
MMGWKNKEEFIYIGECPWVASVGTHIPLSTSTLRNTSPASQIRCTN